MMENKDNPKTVISNFVYNAGSCLFHLFLIGGSLCMLANYTIPLLRGGEKVKPDEQIESVESKRIEDLFFANPSELSDLEKISFSDEKSDFKNQQGILAPIFADDYNSTPSWTLSNGLFVSSEGYFLTCGHSIEKSREFSVKEYYVSIPGKYFFPMNLVAYSKESDLALLRVFDSNEQWDEFKGNVKNVNLSSSRINLVFSSLLVGKRSVYSIQIPLVEEQSQSHFTSDENLYRHKSLWAKGIVVKPGQSGSPLYNANGNLVGIVKSSNEARKHSHFVPAEVIHQFIYQCRNR